MLMGASRGAATIPCLRFLAVVVDALGVDILSVLRKLERDLDHTSENSEPDDQGQVVKVKLASDGISSKQFWFTFIYS